MKNYEIQKTLDWTPTSNSCTGEHKQVLVPGRPYAAYCLACSSVGYARSTVVFNSNAPAGLPRRDIVDARDLLKAQIKRKLGDWRELEEKANRAKEELDNLSELLCYITCPVCEAELSGGVEEAREAMLEAKAAGREDGTCPDCAAKEAAK